MQECVQCRGGRSTIVLLLLLCPSMCCCRPCVTKHPNAHRPAPTYRQRGIAALKILIAPLAKQQQFLVCHDVTAAQHLDCSATTHSRLCVQSCKYVFDTITATVKAVEANNPSGGWPLLIGARVEAWAPPSSAHQPMHDRGCPPLDAGTWAGVSRAACPASPP